jgi:hypothetical protein
MQSSYTNSSLPEAAIMKLEICLMLAGVWLGVLITTELMRRHHHKWEARAVDHGVMNQPRRNATAILHVCSICGEARSTTVAGTYTIHQIRGGQHEAESCRQSIQWSAYDRKFAESLKVSL